MFYNRPQYPLQVRSQFSRPYGYTRNTRYNTLTEPQQMEQPTRWPQQQQWGWDTGMHTACPATDILELDEQFVLEIALPGVVLDDVELKVEENILTVIAKRTPNMFEERASLLRKEMPCGYFIRHFEFEAPIFADHIEARMDRGILFVSLPKVEAAMRIPVSAGSIESHHVPGLKTRVGEKGRSSREVSVK
ncbi:MAG TPA: Hsp20/alpha crystallin family protein [Candidatus Obscuribacterales bacterium]